MEEKLYTKVEWDLNLLKTELDAIAEQYRDLSATQAKVKDAVHDIKNTLVSWEGVMSLIETVNLINEVNSLKAEVNAIRAKMKWWSGNWFKFVVAATIIFGVIFGLGEVYPKLNDASSQATVKKIEKLAKET
jgi:hypothetical protein